MNGLDRQRSVCGCKLSSQSVSTISCFLLSGICMNPTGLFRNVMLEPLLRAVNVSVFTALQHAVFAQFDQDAKDEGQEEGLAYALMRT